MANQNPAQIQAGEGVAVRKFHGGLQTKRYYTPAGEVVNRPPAIRNRNIRDPRTGKVIRNESYDDNIESKGLSLKMPTELKVKCTGCRRWHDTQGEVDDCINGRVARHAKWKQEDDKIRLEARASNELSAPSTDTEERLDKLEEGLSDIKALLQQALGAKNG